MASWVWHCLGEPVAQGSMRAFKHKTTGKIVMTDDKPALKPWRQQVMVAAFGAGPCLVGPVAVRLVFTVPRPKKAAAGDLAPYRQTGDLDKLTRAVLDAVTDAKLVEDDAQVAQFTRLAKVYAMGHRGTDHEALPVPGVVMAAVEMLPDGDGKLAHVQTALRDLVQARLAYVWDAQMQWKGTQ